MQIIIPFLLLFLFFLANGRRRQYCHEDDQILIKPKNSTFYNTQYTRMLRDTFFLGTGTEFHFRGNGKLPSLNLVFQERWCIDPINGSLRNANNGLYLERIFVSSGGASALILGASYSNEWNIIRHKGDTYSIVYKYPERNGKNLALSNFIDENGAVITRMLTYEKDDINQHWIFE